MNIPEAAPGQTVIGTACWSCGTQLYKTVPRLRRGSGHVLWACDDCGVAWSSPRPASLSPASPSPASPSPAEPRAA